MNGKAQTLEILEQTLTILKMSPNFAQLDFRKWLL